MPPLCGVSGMREIDGGFLYYVVLVRDVFEVKVENRLYYEGFPKFLRADSVKRRTPAVRGTALHPRLDDCTI